MEEIDVIICLKKRKKDLENIKKVIIKLKIQNKKICLFLITCYKNGKKVLDFNGIDIIKCKFDKDIQPIIIDKVQIKGIMLSEKKNIVIKVHTNITLDIGCNMSYYNQWL